MSEPEALPNGDADHDHPDIYGSLNAMERAFHIILCTVLDELEPSQRERIRKSLDVYRRELLGEGNEEREQMWIGSTILRFIWAMDNHTPLKDIDPHAPELQR